MSDTSRLYEYFDLPNGSAIWNGLLNALPFILIYILGLFVTRKMGKVNWESISILSKILVFLWLISIPLAIYHLWPIIILADYIIGLVMALIFVIAIITLLFTLLKN